MSQENLPEFGISKNIKQVGRTDLPGGGLVTVENGYATSAISIRPLELPSSTFMIQSTPSWSPSSKCRKEFIRTKCGSAAT